MQQEKTINHLNPLERHTVFTPIIPIEKLMQRITENTTLSDISYLLQTYGGYKGCDIIHLKQRHRTRLEYMELTGTLLNKLGSTVHCIPLTQPTENNKYGFNIYICQNGLLVVPRKGNTSWPLAGFSTTHSASQVSEYLIVGVKYLAGIVGEAS